MKNDRWRLYVFCGVLSPVFSFFADELCFFATLFFCDSSSFVFPFFRGVLTPLFSVTNFVFPGNFIALRSFLLRKKEGGSSVGGGAVDFLALVAVQP